MNYIQIPDFVFDDVIRLLEEGVNVAKNVDFGSDSELDGSGCDLEKDDLKSILDKNRQKSEHTNKNQT